MRSKLLNPLSDFQSPSWICGRPILAVDKPDRPPLVLAAGDFSVPRQESRQLTDKSMMSFGNHDHLGWPGLHGPGSLGWLSS
jgi:hypothetical protein